VAATFEKANTYGFASSLIRNAEVVGSNPICSTTRITQSILYRMDSIKTFPKDVQNILQEIRRTIKEGGAHGRRIDHLSDTRIQIER
jgi:hypothetical protein